MLRNTLTTLLIVFFAVPALGELQQEIELEFDAVEGATQYEIEVTSSNPKFKTLSLVRSKPAWKFSLPGGQYKLRSRSYDDRKVAGPWSEAQAFEIVSPAVPMLNPKNKAKLIAKDKEEEEVKFTWQEIPGVEDYKIEIKGEGGFSKTDTSGKPEFSIDLDVAKQYSWRVMALDGDGRVISKVPEFRTFGIYGTKVEMPEIEKPGSDIVKKLEWSKPKFTETYSIAIQRKTKAGKWKSVKKEKDFKQQEIAFDSKWKGGDYRIAVRAHATGRASSDVAKMSFKVAGGKRRLAALQQNQLKESIEKKTNFYFIASYLLTSMQYSGQHLQTKINFNAVGGTGRLGLGYNFTKSPWSIFGIADMSGFDIGGARYTFPSAEIHGVYKRYWNNWMFRTSSGLFMKDLPEVTGLEGLGDSTSEVESVSTMGPHIGFDVWRAFTVKYGLQLSARVYMNMVDLSTPDGLGIENSMNMQFSVYGSYKLTESMMGLAGYAYRLDKATYFANPNDTDQNTLESVGEGSVNTISIGGHYINFILEWDF